MSESQAKSVKCWRGNYAEPHPEGKDYRTQLRCLFYEKWVNPTGYTCQLCASGVWPRPKPAPNKPVANKRGCAGCRKKMGDIMRKNAGIA